MIVNETHVKKWSPSPADLLEETIKKGFKLLPRNNNWDKARIEGVVKEESHFIKPGLGIYADEYGGPSHVTIKGKGTPSITANQLHELSQQALICKYIVAGTPVPFPLVFPIWKSVASSFGWVNGGIYSQFPSFIGFSPRGIDYRSLMDPEPGRCRRTDGKKWRCGKNVLPNQKYCERHMHRGRLRSRKPVESAENISQSNAPTTTCSNKTKQTIKSHDPADTNTKLPIPVPRNHQFKIPCFNRSNDFPATVASITTSSANGKSRGNNNVIVNCVKASRPGAINTCTHNNSNINNCSTDITTTMVANTFHDANTDNAISRKNSNYLGGKDAGFNHINDKTNNNINRKNGNNQSGFVTPEFVFTLKSVRHGDTSSSNSSCDNRCVAEVEPQRCRRTDGKKWRCSRDVVPQQKYCDSHMHRGAKKLMVSSEAVTVAAASPPPVAKPKNDHINLNITVDSPQPTSDDVNNSTSGSSSDATTVTDENTTVSHLSARSDC